MNIKDKTVLIPALRPGRKKHGITVSRPRLSSLRDQSKNRMPVQTRDIPVLDVRFEGALSSESAALPFFYNLC
jgi:hypothetical protein